MTLSPKITPFLWFESQAKEAAEYYVGIFPDSRIVSENPFVVAFEICGQRFSTLNGGPHDQFNDAAYVEIADGSNVEAILHDDTQLTSRLFPGSLEKGVIRRARILGCFLPAASAGKTARELRDQFIRSAPPLTT